MQQRNLLSLFAIAVKFGCTGAVFHRYLNHVLTNSTLCTFFFKDKNKADKFKFYAYTKYRYIFTSSRYWQGKKAFYKVINCYCPDSLNQSKFIATSLKQLSKKYFAITQGFGQFNTSLKRS